ncbi:MAG TPA: KUP/HAK/KT family potassium transporter [Chitinispirillaceae bacterium]|nr:KUP/HAK/KT family potassium transporter [Chitinispirillaceae bacterium]
MSDIHSDTPVQAGTRNKSLLKASLLLGALGVVFGDIGTSPLYALRECFSGTHAITVVRENILGSVSLIFWLIILIVCVKYVLLLMKADNKGEGGIIALMALIDRISANARKYSFFISLFGIIGAALLFSDAIITPAVSVLSAVEGLKVITPHFNRIVIPISIIILVSLFLIQSKGTARIGNLFGPLILTWFVTIGVLGGIAIFKNPDIINAVNPYYAVRMLITNHHLAFGIIGTAFLSVTGAEVLYADMGHFGRRPIKTIWFSLVLPCLVCNYFGQGAYLLSSDGVPDNLFYRLAPTWFVLPLVLLATLATSIASQAVITGLFSLGRQAIQLGFWPRLRIIHTSAHTIGQVFIPAINMILCICTIILIIVFRESSGLANAYGIAVSATMLLTTVMALFVARQIWKAPMAMILSVWVLFVILNSFIFIANLVKVVSGGWFVIFIAASLCIMMLTWVKGRTMLGKRFAAEAVPIPLFVQDTMNLKPIRVNGIAVFLSANVAGTPRSLLHNYKHNKVIHEKTLIVNIQNQDVPTISEHDRAEVTDLGGGLYHILLKFGFMETPDVPNVLFKVNIPDVHFDNMQVTYFLGKERLVISKRKTMYRWQKQLFHFLAHNSLDATTYFNLPSNRVVELGMQIEL